MTLPANVAELHPEIAAPRRTAHRARVLGVVAMLVVLVLATGLRLWELGDQSLWYDEIFGVVLAQQPMSVVLDVITGFVANMALYLVFMHYWMALIGPVASDAIVRLPSVILGVAGVLAIYRLGADLFDRRAGVVAALLLAVSPYHIGWSQDARSYTMWALWVTLAVWTLVRATRAPRRREWWLAYALVMMLAFYSHLFTAFLALAQGLWILSRRRRLELIGFVGASVILGLTLIPLLVFGASNTDGSQLRHVPLPDWKDVRLLVRSYTGGELAQLAYASLAVLGLGTLVLAPRHPEWRSSAVLLLLWLVLLPVLVLLLSVVYKPLFRERYVFASLPALCLLASAAFCRPRLAALGLPVLGVLLALSVNATFAGFGVRRDEDWRSATQYLVQQAQPGDGFIFISRRNHLPWQYYAPRYGMDPLAIEDLEPFDWHELATSRTYRAPAFSRAELDAFASTHPRIWLVLSHEFDAQETSNDRGDTSAWVRDRLTRTGFGARQRIFPSIRVLLYEKRR